MIEAISADALAIMLGQVPTATAPAALGTMYDAWLKRRAEEAHEVLLAELASGNRLDGDFNPDMFFSLLFRYLNAVKHGAARRNLQLIAQLIKSGISRPYELHIDDLSSIADSVATLSRDEIVVLASFWRNSPAQPSDDDDKRRLSIQEKVMEELVPHHFASKSDVFTIGSMLLRTGFIRMPPVYGGNRVDTTPRFILLMKTCRIETALS